MKLLLAYVGGITSFEVQNHIYTYGVMRHLFLKLSNSTINNLSWRQNLLKLIIGASSIPEQIDRNLKKSVFFSKI